MKDAFNAIWLYSVGRLSKGTCKPGMFCPMSIYVCWYPAVLMTGKGQKD